LRKQKQTKMFFQLILGFLLIYRHSPGLTSCASTYGGPSGKSHDTITRLVQLR